MIPDLTRCTDKEIAQMDDHWSCQYRQSLQEYATAIDKGARITAPNTSSCTEFSIDLKKIPHSGAPVRPWLLREVQREEAARNYSGPGVLVD